MSNKRKSKKNKKRKDGKHFALKREIISKKELPFGLMSKWSSSDILKSLSLSLSKAQLESFLEFDPFNITIRQLGKVKFFGNLSLKLELPIMAFLFSRYSTELKRFEKLMRDFEIQFVLQDYLKCLDILSKVKSEFGQSKWLLRNEILVHQLHYGLDSQKKLLQEIRSDALVDNLTKTLAYFYSIRVETEISWNSYHQNHVYQNIERSLKKGNLDRETAQFYEYNIAHYEGDKLRDPESLFWYEKSFSLIDAYLFFIKLGVIAFSQKNYPKLRKSYEDILPLIASLFEETSVHRLGCLFGINDLEVTELDKIFVEALDQYTNGNYNSEKIVDFINGNSQLYLEKSELIARAGIENGPLSSGISESIVKNYSNIITKNDELPQSYDEILKLGLNTLGLGISSKILSFIDRESANKANSSKFNDLFAYVMLGDFNPRLISYIQNHQNGLYGEFDFSKSVSVNLFQCIKNDEVETLKDSLPDYRYYKYLGITYYNKGRFQEASEMFEKSLFTSREIDKFSTFRYLAFSYLKLDDWKKCLSLVVRESLKNSAVISILPVPKLVDRLLVENSYDGEDALRASITFDICLKYYDIRKEIEEARGYAFEDFLDENSFERPSDVSKELEQLYADEIVYFYEKICRQNIMDVSENFDSQHELHTERILILNKLLLINPSKSDIYQQEIKDCTLELTVGKRVQESEMGKIRINESAVKSEIKKNIAEDFRRYLELNKVKLYEGDDIQQFIYDLLLPENEAVALLNSIVDKAKSVYLHSVNGIDANLSIDIRHGTFSNVIKRSLKEHRLMVLFEGDSPVYDSIDFTNLDAHQKNLLSGTLLELSRKINTLVSYMLKKILQVKDSGESKPAAFFVEIESLDFVKLRNITKRNNSLDEFVDYLIELFWEKIEVRLESLKQFLNVDMNRSLSRIFSNAISCLEDSNEFVGMPQLQKMKVARTDTSNDLTRILNWFNRGEGAEIEDFSVDLLSEVAKKTIENYYPDRVVKVSTKNDVVSKISGSHLRDLTTILAICFSNAVVHSGLGNDELEIRQRYSKEGNKLFFEIENDLSSDIDLKKLKKDLKKLENDIKQKDKEAFVKTEGGTGIFKIYSILKNEFKDNPHMEFDVRKKKFYINITVGVNYV
jgi:hypothetical protein